MHDILESSDFGSISYDANVVFMTEVAIPRLFHLSDPGISDFKLFKLFTSLRGSNAQYVFSPSQIMASSWQASAQWIWIPNYHEEDNRPGRYFLFRKSFQWSARCHLNKFLLHVSADSRYRLFVNGQRVSFGPCKGYGERWYYETVDIFPHLTEGANVISARVLRYSSIEPGSSSIISSELPGLMVYGEIEVGVMIQLCDEYVFPV